MDIEHYITQPTTCLHDGYRTRRVLKIVVPVLVILSLTCANKKYRRNLVAYSCWHHYWTNFVKQFSFPIRLKQVVGSEPLIANACLP